MPAQAKLRKDNGESMIELGLRPGERVVVDGQDKLQQGSRVKLADATPKSEARIRRP